jgi:hypothetical protein
MKVSCLFKLCLSLIIFLLICGSHAYGQTHYGPRVKEKLVTYENEISVCLRDLINSLEYLSQSKRVDDHEIVSGIYTEVEGCDNQLIALDLMHDIYDSITLQKDKKNRIRYLDIYRKHSVKVFDSRIKLISKTLNYVNNQNVVSTTRECKEKIQAVREVLDQLRY